MFVRFTNSWLREKRVVISAVYIVSLSCFALLSGWSDCATMSWCEALVDGR